VIVEARLIALCKPVGSFSAVQVSAPSSKFDPDSQARCDLAMESRGLHRLRPCARRVQTVGDALHFREVLPPWFLATGPSGRGKSVAVENGSREWMRSGFGNALTLINCEACCPAEITPVDCEIKSRVPREHITPTLGRVIPRACCEFWGRTRSRVLVSASRRTILCLDFRLSSTMNGPEESSRSRGRARQHARRARYPIVSQRMSPIRIELCLRPPAILIGL